jgi:hypothetical protein
MTQLPVVVEVAGAAVDFPVAAPPQAAVFRPALDDLAR